MPALSSLSQMPPVLSVPTNLRPLHRQAFRTRQTFSEDEDEEDEEDTEDVGAVEEGEETNRQEESDELPPPVSRDIFRLRYEALGASLTGSSEPPHALAADVDVFNPDWTCQDLEYTTLGFGKKTASFVCKSISFRCYEYYQFMRMLAN